MKVSDKTRIELVTPTSAVRLIDDAVDLKDQDTILGNILAGIASLRLTTQ